MTYALILMGVIKWYITLYMLLFKSFNRWFIWGIIEALRFTIAVIGVDVCDIVSYWKKCACNVEVCVNVLFKCVIHQLDINLSMVFYTDSWYW